MSAIGILRERGYLSALDSELTRVLARLGNEHDPDVLLGAALASRVVRDGDVCADLGVIAGTQALDDDGEPILGVAFPELGVWREKLQASRLVSDGTQPSPLVLDERSRLYLARYHQHERVLARRIVELAIDVPLPERPLGPALQQLFGPTPAVEDAQRSAAMVAVLRRLCVVSGGPGTGKTSTVVKILALLALALDRPLKARLLAPTGKAAQRLSEAVRQNKAALPIDESVKTAIVDEASTIHRALGLATRNPLGVDNPLRSDVIVVDESSMVDLPLMRRLFDAVPEGARVVLLGDAHQLASVEAGAVFGDLCQAAQSAGFSRSLVERARSVFGETLPERERPEGAIADSVVTLTKSHRFQDEGGIGGLARAIFAADATRALELCRTSPDISLSELGPNELTLRLSEILVERYAKLVKATSPAEAFLELARFRLLTAHRKGPFGVERLNLLCEQALHERGLIDPELGRFYPGRPVLVTQNDYQLGLFNGDVGVVLAIDGISRVYFPKPEGGERTLVPSRLPEHQTVFAMSIHKSQGSEFDEVAIVLPEPRSPLLTRELCYTAITRARNRVELYGPADSLAVGIGRRTRRASGLADALVQETSNSLKA